MTKTNISKKVEYLYTDIMRDYVWPFYHRWVLHFGKRYNYFASCGHHNPYYSLTPRLFDRQVRSAKKSL